MPSTSRPFRKRSYVTRLFGVEHEGRYAGLRQLRQLHDLAVHATGDVHAAGAGQGPFDFPQVRWGYSAYDLKVLCARTTYICADACARTTYICADACINAVHVRADAHLFRAKHPGKTDDQLIA